MTANQSSFNLLNYFLSDQRLQDAGSRTAIDFRGHLLTYADLRREVSYWAEKLSPTVSEGDRVAMLLYDSPEFIAAFLATLSMGAICVPINTFLPIRDVDFILSDSGAKVLIAEAQLISSTGTRSRFNDGEMTLIEVERDSSRSYGESASPLRPSEKTTRETPAFILYTSGSTGTPKGALHLQGNVPAVVEGFGKSVLKLTQEDRVFSSSRLFFAYGLGNSLTFPLAAGATVILESDRITPQRIAEIFREQKPTVFCGVPSVYRALLDLHSEGGGLDVASLTTCVSAGEALPATIFEQWRREFNLEILDGIGSTEMLHMFISNHRGETRAGSSGEIVKGYEARILQDDGTLTDRGEQGNLWVKGASAMRGYWGREDLTAAVIRDGWMKTGDVYRQDEDGFYYHIGRSDDCFKVKGLWVSPVEVESALLEHPDIAEAAVIASTDADGLATTKAFLVIRTERESEKMKEELIEFARQRLVPYKVPTQFAFIAEMPRTSTGKIQRYKLRGRDEG